MVLEKYVHDILAMVPSGAEDVELFSNSLPKPDLIILDHSLEKTSGLKALRKILDIESNARILFAGAGDFIMKHTITAGN